MLVFRNLSLSRVDPRASLPRPPFSPRGIIRVDKRHSAALLINLEQRLRTSLISRLRVETMQREWGMDDFIMDDRFSIRFR